MPPTLEQLRRYAIARSLFKPTTLPRAIRKLGFVQADPIRAPARAQDLTLRHRVIGYRAGDLERRYPRLSLEEDYFVNYGYLLREHHRLMHPRTPPKRWSPSRAARAQELLAFIREQGTAHPRIVDRRFAHGKILNWFGGATNATTRLLDEMHYRGLLRVARRDSGTRVYAPREADPEPAAGDEIPVNERIDTLVDLVVSKYAPLPARSLTQLLVSQGARPGRTREPPRAAPRDLAPLDGAGIQRRGSVPAVSQQRHCKPGQPAVSGARREPICRLAPED